MLLLSEVLCCLDMSKAHHISSVCYNICWPQTGQTSRHKYLRRVACLAITILLVNLPCFVHQLCHVDVCMYNTLCIAEQIPLCIFFYMDVMENRFTNSIILIQCQICLSVHLYPQHSIFQVQRCDCLSSIGLFLLLVF